MTPHYEEQMDDRKLLEMAARAAGLTFAAATLRLDGVMYVVTKEYGRWNALTNDADALRLAVKLGLDLCVAPSTALCAWSEVASDWIEEQPGNDPCAAMRRAITRAAASIGAGKEV